MHKWKILVYSWRKKKVNVSKPQNNICLHMWCSFKYVPVRAPIFTYLLCRAFSQIKNSNFLNKAAWWRAKAKFCSSPLVVGGIHYQLNRPCQAIPWKQFQHGQNGKCTDTPYFQWSWNQPGLTGCLKSVMSVHIWICLETWAWKVTFKVIAEFRQYMVPNKHPWDNKWIKSRPGDLFFHLTSNSRYLFPPWQLKWHSWIP